MSLHDFRSVFMPYCLQRVEGNLWRVLNREYQPVGNGNKNTYAGYGEVTLIKIHASNIKKLRESLFDDQHFDDKVWLYNDGCIPTSSASAMKQYLARVALLMKTKTVPSNGT